MSFESLAAAAFAPPPQFSMQKTPLWDGELRTPDSFTGEQSEQSTYRRGGFSLAKGGH